MNDWKKDLQVAAKSIGIQCQITASDKQQKLKPFAIAKEGRMEWLRRKKKEALKKHPYTGKVRIYHAGESKKVSDSICLETARKLSPSEFFAQRERIKEDAKYLHEVMERERLLKKKQEEKRSGSIHCMGQIWNRFDLFQKS